MSSNETAKAMVEHYIRLGASKIEQERQWRETAAEILKVDRGAVEGFPRRPSGVTASRVLRGNSR
jgi:hypothetical protein